MRVQTPYFTLMKVKVTRRDIETGQRRVPTSCPVANAVKRKWFIDYVTVGRTSITVAYKWSKHKLYTFVFPGDVTERIKLFDETGAMKPFTFEAEAR